MTTLHIMGDTPAAIKFIEYARTLPFVKESAPDRIQGVPATRAELTDELRLVEAEHDPATCIAHPQVVGKLENQMAEWR
jgi:hypothetical protein